jgi:protein ImuA
MQTIKKEQLERLRKEMLCLQGLGGRSCPDQPAVNLGPLLNHMPGQVFPLGAMHEFLSPTLTTAAATHGFISAILASLMQSGKPCVWVSLRKTVFPPALKSFGIDPDRIVFIEVAREKEALWTIEEALKCKALSAVIGEIKELDFTQSRRLQLATEDSRVTGFINRLCPRGIRPTASVSRWQVSPLGSRTAAGLPGIGFPRWKVELMKIRNGKPGCWEIEWLGNALHIKDSPLQETGPSFIKTGAA